jgi:hypothetical protein
VVIGGVAAVALAPSGRHQAQSTTATTPAASPPSTAAGARQRRTTATTAAAAATTGWASYRDPATGFAISHPQGWTTQAKGLQTTFRDPSSGAYLLVEYTSTPGPSPEGAWYKQEGDFAASHGGYQRVAITPTTFDGFPAAAWEYTYGSGDSRLHAVDLGFVTGRYGFALNFQTKDSDWQRMQPQFEAFKRSFQAP